MPLTTGRLFRTRVNDRWQSTQYWDCTENVWVDIRPGSVCLTISVDKQKICFIHAGRLCSIHNCYNEPTGIPVWCDIL